MFIAQVEVESLSSVRSGMFKHSAPNGAEKGEAA